MQNLNRVHLTGLRAVEAVMRLGGLRAAAAELGVTAGAVSQQVQKTERQLGRVLFVRGRRGLVPTEAGADIAGLLGAGMADLSAAVDLAMRPRDDSLTVSVAPVFAEKWLVWRLKDFSDAYPDLRVRIDAATALVDPNTTDVDACIRVGRGPWPDVRADKLLDHRVFPVAAPALAATLTAPADLAVVPVIRDAQAMFGWRVWLEPHGLDEAILGDGPTFSSASLCLDAAIAGQGVFLAWETLAGDGLKRGSLAAPFPRRVSTGLTYWLITSQRLPKSRAVRAFEDWLKKALETAIGGA